MVKGGESPVRFVFSLLGSGSCSAGPVVVVVVVVCLRCVTMTRPDQKEMEDKPWWRGGLGN